VGLLIGLVVGLVIAVVAALMITRAPVPFINKTGPVAQRLQPPKPGDPVPDPNQPLYDKQRTAPIGEPPPVAAPAPDAAPLSILERLFGRSEPEPAVPASPIPADKPASEAGTVQIKPAASLPPPVSSQPSDGQTPASGAGAPIVASSGVPAGEAPAKASATVRTEPGVAYVLQAGAFRAREDADSMRGKLALFGFEAKVLPAEVNGQTVYRVRLGPYAQADDMNRMRARLAENGIESTVVRQR
jgi:cell division protein FtsN